jgi:hypothetical protein
MKIVITIEDGLADIEVGLTPDKSAVYLHTMRDGRVNSVSVLSAGEARMLLVALDAASDEIVEPDEDDDEEEFARDDCDE